MLKLLILTAALCFGMVELSYHEIKIKGGDTLIQLFGKDWKTVTRFNRIDEKHLIPGRTLKVPDDLRAAKHWTPMPEKYGPAANCDKYVLVLLEQQFIGFYRKGLLAFDAPISSGKPKERCDAKNGNCATPIGIFQALGGDKSHISSLYAMPDGEPYPMDWAIRFYVSTAPNGGNVQYWIHSGELPGYPDSHGCIRLMKKDAEKMFKLIFRRYPDYEFWIKKGRGAIIEIRK